MTTLEQPTGGKRRSGPFKRLQTPPWPGPFVEPGRRFDLRATRDLSSRRLGREWLRGSLRTGMLLTGDTLVTIAAYLVTMSLLGVDRTDDLYMVPRYIVFVLFGQAAAGTYQPGRAHGAYSKVLFGAFAAGGARLFVDSLYNATRLGASAHVIMTIVLAVMLCVWRFGLSRLIRLAYSRGVGLKRTLIVADRERATEVADHFRSADEPRIRHVGYVSTSADDDASALGSIDDLSRLIEDHDVSYVVVAGSLPREQFERVVHACFMHGTAVSVVPATLTAVPCRLTSREVLGWPLLQLEAPGMHMLQVIVKRTMDIAGASFLLVTLAPLLGAIALGIRMEGPGPIFFRQSRPGLGGKRFWMLKFRTMRPDAEQILERDPELFKRFLANDCKLPANEDPRISKLGAVLRKSSLDELPQLWNVLRGDMSLIGPRPVVGPELDQYGEWVSTVLGVKPGMTGYWQVAGRSSVAFPERANLDVYYVTRWSIGLDLMILARTIPAVIRRRGAH